MRDERYFAQVTLKGKSKFLGLGKPHEIRGLKFEDPITLEVDEPSLKVLRLPEDMSGFSRKQISTKFGDLLFEHDGQFNGTTAFCVNRRPDWTRRRSTYDDAGEVTRREPEVEKSLFSSVTNFKLKVVRIKAETKE